MKPEYIIPLPPRPSWQETAPQPAVLELRPTLTDPGSEARIRALAARAALGLGLHVAGDVYDRTPGAGTRRSTGGRPRKNAA